MSTADDVESPELAAFRAEVRAWLEAEAELAEVADSQGSLLSSPTEDDLPEARRLQEALSAAGLAGISWPAEYGGRGLSVIEELIFSEESAAFHLPVDIFVIGTHLVGPTLISHGTPEQQDRFLPRILDGSDVWCQLFSEPEAGSDLASLRTTAVADGDEWTLNGQKVWTSGALTSNWGILPARTDPSVPKHRGISYFAVRMDSPGVTIRPLKQMSGHEHFCEVFLDDVRVPNDQLIGGESNGWAVTRTTLQNERHMTGASHGAVNFDSLLELAKATNPDGDKIDSALRERLIKTFIQSEILRIIGLRTTTALLQGKEPGPESSVAKLAVANMVRDAADLALELMGPTAVAQDVGAEIDGWVDFFLMAPALRIAGGTDEIQRNILAERVLGLPREDDPTRSVAFNARSATNT